MRQLAAVILFLATCVAAAGQAPHPKFFHDDPLVAEPPPRPVTGIASRKLSDYFDILWHLLKTPGEEQHEGAWIAAQGVNTLGDPMEGAWWERRHYWRRMTPAELARGPERDVAPAMDGPWTVVSAKTEGVTPGFVILDRHRRRYFVKFDPATNPEMATGADQISLKIFYALGYHVPENYLISFDPELLELGEDVAVEDRLGRKRAMTRRDLFEILERVHRGPDGRYRATASLAVPGKPLGPYRYFGTRSDDPNDVVPHEHRRDLRGMRLAAAWVKHDDSRAINTFDSLTDGPSGAYVKHYQLDFGSTLGSASYKPDSPRAGGEYLFGWKQAGVQLLTLGLAVPGWARADYPDIPAVGRFESRRFRPDQWVPEYPNPAFLNSLPDDEFWMAKQILNLRDEEIRTIVGTARYSDPRAAEWIAACLIERRDKIGRAAFAKVLPIDRFEIAGGRLAWQDLAANAGLDAPLDIRVRWFAYDNERDASEPIPGAESALLPPVPDSGYVMASLESASRPRQVVRVYVRNRAAEVRIVGVERTW